VIYESEDNSHATSGEEWKPSEAASETDVSVQLPKLSTTTNHYRKKRLQEWVSEQRMRSYIDSEDGEESVIPPSTDRGRSTKRLPVFSKQGDRKGPTKMLPVVDIIHEHDSPSKMERKDCGSPSQCHICGKSIKRLNTLDGGTR